ncbi:acetyltransferase [Luteimonas sp. R10]|uniref:acetyltransferase n=1 Tax=Luteimonas sp. R10 TaxID=3108176 RepID=UPI00308BC31A|nr:acetyltransferase [Luteimonas sp. R10]
MKPALVIGGSSFGRLIRSLLVDAGYDFRGYIDDFNTGDEIIGTRDDLGRRFHPGDFCLVLAIGYRDLPARLRVFHQAIEAGFSFPPVVHPRAIVSREARIGAGCLLMAGANVDSFARLGPACVLWPGAIVSHDSTIGENTFISPNATVCGFVQAGHSSFIGAGSVIVDGTKLPEKSFVKAGTRSGGNRINV